MCLHANAWHVIIFSSSGYDGVVISTIKMQELSVRGTKIIAECGVKGPCASQTALKHSLTGFEFMIGFPGSIGGNVCMNAGCHGQSISDAFVKACVFDIKTKDIIYGTFTFRGPSPFSIRHSRQAICHEKMR